MSGNTLATPDAGASKVLYRAVGAEWTCGDVDTALGEGWDLCPGDQGLAIRKCPDGPEFSSDAAAVDHVKARAARGSDVHRRALTIHLAAHATAGTSDQSARLGKGARSWWPWVSSCRF